MSARYLRGSVIHNRHDPLDKGLVGEWRFDKNTGLMLPDSSGYNSVLTAYFNPAWVTTPYGPGLRCLDANTQYLSGTIPHLPQGDDPYSIEVAYYGCDAVTLGGNHFVFWGAESPGEAIGFRLVNDTESLVHYWWGADQTLDTNVAGYFTDGGWHHCIATYDGTTRATYADLIYSTSDSPGAHDKNGTTFYIGRKITDGNDVANFTFLLVRIYNRALTANEVAARYQIVRKRMQTFGGERRLTIALAPSGATTSTSTTTSTSSSTSTTTTLAFSGGLAFGEESPVGETPVSWQTFSDGAAGLPTIIGDSDWGKIELDVPEEGRSKVYDFGDSDSRTITVTENKYGAGQQSATIQIRGQNAVFAQDDANPSWETYSAPANKTWRYIQVRAYNQS